jgi:hypothetical protein
MAIFGFCTDAKEIFICSLSIDEPPPFPLLKKKFDSCIMGQLTA